MSCVGTYFHNIRKYSYMMRELLWKILMLPGFLRTMFICALTVVDYMIVRLRKEEGPYLEKFPFLDELFTEFRGFGALRLWA